MPTVADLNQRHPSINVKRVEKLTALYEGGELFEKQLEDFLPQRPAENDTRYKCRKAEFRYRNYLGPIVDYFASLLFAESLSATAKNDQGDAVELDPFYSEFLGDADGAGCDLNEIAKELLTEACVKRCSWLRLEHADDGGPSPENAKDFYDRGLGRCWVHRVPFEQVYDWDTDDDGRLLWVILHSQTARRQGLAGKRNVITETWEYVDAAAVTTFQISYDAKKKPRPEDDVPQIGAPVPHRFGAVPLVELRLKPALWVANRLMTPQLSHFRLSNAQSWGLTASCFPQPVFKCENDGEGKPRQPVMGAGYGIMMGVNESMEWVAPPAAPFDSLGNEIKSEKDEIYRVAHQMALGVENNAAAIGRTAESKKTDAAATRVVLIAFSKTVREAIEKVYDLIGAARGEKNKWSIGGLDDFAALDAGGLMEMLVNLDKAGGIPSDSFMIEFLTRLADSLLGDADESLKSKIHDEIRESIENPEPSADLTTLHDLADTIANGKTKPRGSRRAGGKEPPGTPSGGNGGARAPAPAA